MTTQPQTDVTPSAFLCYARSDDEHDGGALSDLRKQLSGEVHAQTGKDFPIFQDRNDIEWGDNWRQRIDGSLNAVTFLICVLTPSFLASDECNREVKVFLEREAKLGRNDLILPAYYIDCPTLEADARLDASEVSTELAKRQRVDWRKLRHKLITSEGVLTIIDETAGKIVQAVNRVTLDTPGESGTTSESSAGVRTGSATDDAPGAQRTTRIVKPGDSNAHATIAEAIEAADHGDRILVHPGLYEDPLVIDKAIEIIGEGNRDEIIVQVSGANTLLARTSLGRVANLTLRQTGGGKWYCVDIAQGRLELEACDISSESLSCVTIRNGADPRIVRNRIHDGKQTGVFVHTNGLGTIEDNDIFGHAFSGFVIKEGGNPTVRGNRIHDGEQAGFYIHTNGRGMLEDNDVFGNVLSGVVVGVGGNATMRRNRINGNGNSGITIQDGGGGTFTDNDLRGNKRGAWNISDGSIDNVERSGNIEDEDAEDEPG